MRDLIPPILVVEDSDFDAEYLRCVLNRANITNPLVHMSTAEEALLYLGRAEDVPVIVLLDLNLPGLDGPGLLRRMNADQRLRMIPVVVVSANPEEFELSGMSGMIACVMQKPVDPERFVELTKEASDGYLVINSTDCVQERPEE